MTSEQINQTLCSLLNIKLQYNLCLSCDELSLVDFPVISDLYAGFIRPECSHCGKIMRAENIRPLSDAERIEWSMPPLSARAKLSLKGLRMRLPNYLGIISWV